MASSHFVTLPKIVDQNFWRAFPRRPQALWVTAFWLSANVFGQQLTAPPPPPFWPSAATCGRQQQTRSRLAISGVKCLPRGLVNFQLLPSGSQSCGLFFLQGDGVPHVATPKNKRWPLCYNYPASLPLPLGKIGNVFPADKKKKIWQRCDIEGLADWGVDGWPIKLNG